MMVELQLSSEGNRCSQFSLGKLPPNAMYAMTSRVNRAAMEVTSAITNFVL